MEFSEKKSRNQISEDFKQGRWIMAVVRIHIANINWITYTSRCWAGFRHQGSPYYFSTLIILSLQKNYLSNYKSSNLFSHLKK